MPVETATFIPDLVPANPAHTDGLNQADSHLRLLKTVLQNQFTAIGDNAVTVTAGQLNLAGNMSGTAGIVDVPQQSPTVGAKVILSPPADNGGDVVLLNSGTAAAAGALAITVSDSANANPHTVVSADYTGNVTALTSVNSPSIKKGGNELLPTGVICLWSGSSASIPAGWLLCNGTSGTPDLRDRFIVGAGGSYGVGANGGATSTTPTSSSDGAHAHGAATLAAGAHTPTGAMDGQGAHNHSGFTDNHNLVESEIPSHVHQQFTGGSGGGGPLPSTGGGGAANFSASTSATGGGGGHSHGIFFDGVHVHNIAMNAVADHQHAIASDGAHTHTVTVATVPPYYALCYIYKV